MNTQELINQIQERLNSVSSLQDLNNLKVEYLGKTGIITELQSKIKEIPNEEKKEYGMKVNEVRTYFNNQYEEKNNKLQEELLNKKLESEKIDISLPSKKTKRGSLHPMTRIQSEFEDIFVSMGYTVYDGPEIESDENCFQKLNLPKGHPAREMQDSFYINPTMLLRTHTSPVQAHTLLESKGQPIKIICPGKVYRRDNDDATHSHQFMQCEGLVVGENVTMSDLKGTLTTLASKIFGDKLAVRFRPSFFPFTEPSVEVDVQCFKCGGKGCNLCKGSGWIEVLGAGMVHPNVLNMAGYDTEKYQGFAFGVGIERIAMLRYGIDDIRGFYTNDIRFLKQF